MTRRRFRQIATGANPTLESLTRREPTRRIFRELQPGRGPVFDPLWIGYQRRFTCVGPVLGDTSIAGHTADWLYDKAYHWYTNTYALPEWPPFWCYYSTVGSHTVGDSFFPATVKLRPIRFRLANILFPGAQWVGDDNLFSTAPNRMQRSDKAAPATSDGHFSGSRIQTVSFGQGALSQVDAGPSKVVAARLLVNGTDVSGVVTVDHSFTARNGVQFRGSWASAAAPSITLPSPINLSGGETIEVDFWVEMRVTLDPTRDRLPTSGNGGMTGLRTSLIYGVGPTNQINQADHPWARFVPMIAARGTNPLYVKTSPFFFTSEPVCSPGQINIHRRLRGNETWTLNFIGNTIDGLSTLTLGPRSGWSYVKQGPVMLMVKPSTTPGTSSWRVEFRYDTETPEIRITVPGRHIGDRGLGLRYHISSAAHYDAHSDWNVPHGPMTLGGTNTFVPSVVNVGFNSSNVHILDYWMPANLYTETYYPLSNYPTSITVTRS